MQKYTNSDMSRPHLITLLRTYEGTSFPAMMSHPLLRERKRDLG